MHHKLYVGLIDPHPECGRCHNNLDFAANKCFLIFHLFTTFHFSVKRQRHKSVFAQFICQLLSFLGPRDINNGWAILGLNQGS